MMLIKLNESTAARRRVPVALVDDTDGKTAETGVTLSAGDMKVSKNGAAEANHGGTLTELAGGDYYYEFSSGEVDTVGYLTGRIVKSGVRTFRIAAQVVAIDLYDTVRAGLTALPNATAGANTGLPVVGTQVPNATAGAANGLVIAGSNAATTFATLTVTGQYTVSDGVVVSCTTANKAAITATGNGVADGVVLAAGTTGAGLKLVGGTVTGAGLTTVDGIVADIIGNLTGDVTGNVAGNVDGTVLGLDTRLPAALVGGRMDSNMQAGATGVLSADLLASDAANEIADALLDRANAIETGLTVRQAHRLEAAAAAGKVSGAATTTVAIRNAVADSKARITATVDADGNRSAITTDVT